MITPLRKRTSEGDLYRRRAHIEMLLAELELLPRDKLVERCAIINRSNASYVPSECLMYFVRASRMDNSDHHFERLYKMLVSRVLSALPNPESRKGEVTHVSSTKSRIREEAFDRFTERLAADRGAYLDKLDYFEIGFDGAVANLRRDGQEKAWREENRTETIEFDPETNEPSERVEKAAGSFNPFNEDALAGKDYRSRLDAAIDSLPREQSRIVHMLRQGFQIDSTDTNTVTIAKTLNKSEKTIRNQRDRAFDAIRKFFDGEGNE